MTCHRKLLLLAPLAVAVPILAMVGFVFRHDSAGWARGEASYKGKYTGQWRAEIERLEVAAIRGESIYHRYWTVRDSPFEKIRSFLGIGRVAGMAELRLLEWDSEAIPVLLALLQDNNPQVRLVACEGLGYLGPDAKVAVPALENARRDADGQVRSEAEWALARIATEQPLALAANPDMLGGLKSLRLIPWLAIMVPVWALIGAFTTLDSGASPFVGLTIGGAIGAFFGCMFGGGLPNKLVDVCFRRPLQRDRALNRARSRFFHFGRHGWFSLAQG